MRGRLGRILADVLDDGGVLYGVEHLVAACASSRSVEPTAYSAQSALRER
jgi:hypothetical protein